ncbi:MAG: hypothetical protein M1827_001800 [Pycnora praestabilis]|nr:MAG: hypothetical protein M1827_001800 [Pycnora praestabilis]
MAPPPPASMPLQQRLIQLFSTLQAGWFVGHLTLLFCVLRYTLSYITFNYYTRWAEFSYRTAFVAAAATYGIVVYKAYRARARAGGRQQGGALALAGDENVQYLATYTRTNLIPTISPPQQSGPSSTASPSGRPTYKSSPLADTIGKFVKEYYDISMTAVAILEIVLWFRLMGPALVFTKGSWIMLGVYTIFFRARYSQSSFVQGAITQVTARADALVANQSTPPAARQAWETVKGLVRQAADATDINRYLGGSGPGARKAQ